MTIAALASAAIAVGCGGESDGNAEGTASSSSPATKASTTITTGPLSKEDYIAHANRYCRHSWTLMRQRIAEYRAEQGPNVSEEKLFTESVWRNLLPGIEFQFDQMHQVLGGAPAGDERQVEEMIGEMQLAIESGERHRPASPRQLVALFATYDQLAKTYGVNDCLVRSSYYRN